MDCVSISHHAAYGCSAGKWTVWLSDHHNVARHVVDHFQTIVDAVESVTNTAKCASALALDVVVCIQSTRSQAYGLTPVEA